MSDTNNSISLEDLVFFDEEVDGDIPTLEKEEENSQSEETTEENIDATVEEDGVDNDTTTEEPQEEDNSNEPQYEDDEEEDSSAEGYFNFLKEQGVLNLPDDFEFDGSSEKLEEAFEVSKQLQKQQAAQEIWAALPPKFQTVLEYGLNGGTDFSKIESLYDGVDYDAFDLENTEHLKAIATEYYKVFTKFSDDKIKRTINRLEQTDLLEDEAEAFLPELKAYKQQEKDRLIQEAAEQEAQNTKIINESFNMFTEHVKSLDGLSDNRKVEIVNSIWTVGEYGGYKDVTYFNYIDAVIKSNPEHLAQLAEMYLDYDPNKGFKTNDLAVKKAERKANNTFKNRLEQQLKGAYKLKGGKTRTTRKKIASLSDINNNLIN